MTKVPDSEITTKLRGFLEALGFELPAVTDPMDDDVAADELKALVRSHPTIRMLMDGAISWKEALWVEFYITHNFNATKAAKLAGYASPSVAASVVHGKTKIRLLIASRLESTVMESAEVLARYRDFADASLEDFFAIDEGGETFKLDLAKAEKAGKLHLLKKIKLGKDGTYEIQLHDQSHALDQLARHVNLFEKELSSLSNPLLVAVSGMDAEQVATRLEELKQLRGESDKKEGEDDGESEDGV